MQSAKVKAIHISFSRQDLQSLTAKYGTLNNSEIYNTSSGLWHVSAAETASSLQLEICYMFGFLFFCLCLKYFDLHWGEHLI